MQKTTATNVYLKERSGPGQSTATLVKKLPGAESRDHFGKRKRPWNISQFDARAHTAIQVKQAKQMKQVKQMKQTLLEMH